MLSHILENARRLGRVVEWQPSGICGGKQKCVLWMCEEFVVQTLACEQGVTFGAQKGSHLKLFYRGCQSILPMHAKELGKGLVETIKKQLGLKEQD
jgi:predicted RNA binding protein YcfA (HicA-like mRNA interferase family)